jgi:adenosylcobinamide-GDP ribazoletransferase
MSDPPAVPAPAVRDRAMGGPLAALGFFSVLPVPGRARNPGPGVLAWFPLVGVLLGALAFLPALAVWRGGGAGSPLLAAALVVMAGALLTRGLHLDGLADLADGLGSARAPEQALAIMRRPDVGAFGVAAICGALVLQVAALTAVLGTSTRLQGLLAVVLTAATGRVAALRAAGHPAAPGSSLGALVAGTATPLLRWIVSIPVVALTAAGRIAVGGTSVEAGWNAAAVLAGLLVAAAVARHAVRRLGGINGDVFGALVEIGATATLVVLAAEAAWT